MLRQARTAGHLQGTWGTGDDADGLAPTLRDALDAQGWHYVLDVPPTMPVFTPPAQATVPPTAVRTQAHPPRLAPAAPLPRTVETVAVSLLFTAWQDLTVAEGAHGPCPYQFVALRAWESRNRLLGHGCWLLLRRTRAGTEPRYYLSNAPAGAPLLTLAHVAVTRWVIETAFETAKGETGLDEDEAHSCPDWHHHITLALLAAAFLLTLQQDGGKETPNTTLAASKIANQNDQLTLYLTLMMRCVKPRYQLRCPCAELGQRHHAKVVLITRPQISRVLCELLSHRTWTDAALFQWLSDTQERNPRAIQPHIKRRLRKQHERLSLPRVA